MKNTEFFIRIAVLNGKELFQLLSSVQRDEGECPFEQFTNHDGIKFIISNDTVSLDGLCWSREQEQNGVLELDSWQVTGLFRAMGVLK